MIFACQLRSSGLVGPSLAHLGCLIFHAAARGIYTGWAWERRWEVGDPD